MKNIKACLSSNSDEWKTPSGIYDFFINTCHFIDLFPFGSDKDQFEISYDNEQLFCNPPFSRLAFVVDYLVDLYLNHNCDFILLMPVRTDTKYFKKLVTTCNSLIYFFDKRLRFNDSLPAPFPSMLVVARHTQYPLNACSWFYIMETDGINLKGFLKLGN